MTDLSTAPADTGGSAAPRPRPLRRRRSLPNGRAVVGGFLVAVAAVGVFAAYVSATAPPVTGYAVAARDLAPGDRIDATAFMLVPIDLPDAQRARAYDEVVPLLDTTVVEPLVAGELVQEGAVVPTRADAGVRTVSFAVEASRAVAGRLQAGERVDVLATFGSGSDACTYVVAADVALVSVGQASDSLVAEGAITVSVALSSADDELAVAHAAGAGTVTLARTTGASTGAPPERFCTPTAAADR